MVVARGLQVIAALLITMNTGWGAAQGQVDAMLTKIPVLAQEISILANLKTIHTGETVRGVVCPTIAARSMNQLARLILAQVAQAIIIHAQTHTLIVRHTLTKQLAVSNQVMVARGADRHAKVETGRRAAVVAIALRKWTNLHAVVRRTSRHVQALTT